MLTLQFVKFFSQGQMRFPTFHILKHPYCHLRCIVRVFQVEEKLQELPGMDPIFVVKTPTLFRTRPAGVKLPADCLRSTWILVHGKWEQVEDRVPPLLQQSRFDKWIERACFQYHHPTSAPIVSLPACASTAARDQFLRAATLELDNHPSLTFSTEILFEQAQRPQKIPFSLHEGIL